MINRILLLLGLFLLISANMMGQAERKYIRQGNKEYKDEKFDESELLYRRALDKDNESYAGPDFSETCGHFDLFCEVSKKRVLP